MNLLFVQHNPGSRTCRMAATLVDQGHTVDLLTRWPPRLHGDAFHRVDWWRNPEELVATLQARAAYDIWHIGQYNDSEWLVPLALTSRDPAAVHVPRIVVDWRDLASLMPIQALYDGHFPWLCEALRLEEITAMRFADGAIHVSPEVERDARFLHGASHPPSTVALSCLRQSELPRLPDTSRSGMVYSGGLYHPGSNTLRDYGQLFSFLVEKGVDLHVQSACLPEDPLTTQIHNAYRERGVVLHERVPDANLPAALTGYRWGLVGFQNPFPLGQDALPNKLFEYLAAGVVPVTAHCAAARRLVAELECGLDLGEWLELSPEGREDLWQRLYPRVVAARAMLTMENQVENILVPFYRQILEFPLRHPKPERITLGYPLFDPWAAAMEAVPVSQAS